MFERSFVRSTAFLPGPYLAVHLMLGLALTAAVTIFVVSAEDVVGRGATVTFDLAFAKALQDAATPTLTRMAFEVIRSRRTISASEVRLQQQRKHGV